MICKLYKGKKYCDYICLYKIENDIFGYYMEIGSMFILNSMWLLDKEEYIEEELLLNSQIYYTGYYNSETGKII